MDNISIYSGMTLNLYTNFMLYISGMFYDILKSCKIIDNDFHIKEN